MTLSEMALRHLADRAAIEAVLVRYAMGVDARDFDAVGSCFSEDADANYAGTRVGPGAQVIVDWLSGLLTNSRPTMHALSNVQIELLENEADAHSYLIVYSTIGDGGDQRVRMRGIQYRDHLVRGDGGWRINYREHSVEWEAAADARPITPIPPTS